MVLSHITQKKMKAKIHVPTKEYAFIEVEVESDDIDSLVHIHDEIANKAMDKEGHNTLEWAKIRNKYAMHNEIEPEDLEGCSKAQKYFINQMKLVYKSLPKE